MEVLTHCTSGISKAMAGPPLQRGRWSVIARLIPVCLALLLWLAACPFVNKLAAQTQDSSVEYQVKAAYLLNFTKFVEWPAGAFAAADAPITICVIGQDQFGAILDRTIEGESVNKHGVRVQRLLPDDNLRSCQVAFICRSERERFAKILSGLRGSKVLTVSDLPGFADAGGMIEFFLEAGKIRFYVNAVTAHAAGLELSSRLLRVAKEVKNPRG